MGKIVVVGAGQGGLSAAIHLAIAGHEVLVVEADEVSGGKARRREEAGFVMDPGPSIIILKHLYEAVFERAGRRMDDYLVFDKLEVVSRVYFEGKEAVDLPAGVEGCLDVIRKVAPEDVRAVETLVAKLDKVAPLVDETVFAQPFLKPQDMMNGGLMKFGLVFNPFKNYRKLVDGMFRSDFLRSFFYGFPSYGGQTYDSNAPGAFLIPYYMMREGTYFPRGGVRAIPAAFERLARELGVEFRFGSRVARVLGAGDRCTGVVLESGEEILADGVVSNVDPLTMMEDRDGEKDWEPSLSYFTFHWGFDSEIDGLDHHNLLVPKEFERGFEQLYRERVFPDRPIVYLNVVGERDAEGRGLAFAVITSPAMVKGVDWVASRDEFRGRLKRVMEDCGVHLPWDKLVFERVQDPEWFSKEHGNFRGSLYGADEEHRMWGMFPLGNRDEKWSNLVYAGGGVQPGAGLPMVTLSGKFAADLLNDVL